MSCNNILDVSCIYFCGPIGTGGRNWIGTGSSFDISTNEALKMIVPSDSSASILVGSTPVLQVDSSHVSISGGTEDNPALNFGLVGDSMTGMWRYDISKIGFSAGGIQTVTICPSGTELDASFSSGLNVGLPGVNFSSDVGIKRLSTDPSNSWEDGNCGNSNYLVFTASDFCNSRHGRSGTLDMTVVTPGATGADGLVMANAAGGASGNELISVKLLPKGFRVNKADFPIEVYSNNSTGTVWGNSATLSVLTQDLATPTISPSPLLSASSLNSWSSGVNNQYFPSNFSSPGNGTLSVVIRITIQQFQQMTSSEALVGVSIPIIRM